MRGFIAVEMVLVSALLGVSAPASSNLLVVPGQRIGQTPLGPQGAQILAHMPKPYRSDAAMSQQYRVWVSPSADGHQDTLFIHTARNGVLGVKPLDGERIDVIRVTSPQFHTTSGIAVGSTFAQIRRRFPDGKAVNYQPAIYDDARHGIAFEFAHAPTPHSRCIALLVHLPQTIGPSPLADAKQVQSLLQTPPP